MVDQQVKLLTVTIQRYNSGPVEVSRLLMLIIEDLRVLEKPTGMHYKKNGESWMSRTVLMPVTI